MRARVIGYINQFVTGPFARIMVESIERTLTERGIRMVAFGTSPGETAATGLARDLVDGWIVLPGEDIRALVATGQPVVTIAAPIPDMGCASVVTDNYGSTHAIVSHLIGHGRTRIAFLGVLENLDFQERCRGYRAALAEAGLEADERLVVDTVGYTSEFQNAAIERLVSGDVPFDAVFCGNDAIAEGVIRAVKRRGQRVPEDVAVVGFDDLEEAQYYDPPLTTVRQRVDLLAEAAVSALVRRIERGERAPERVVVPATLVVRESCGCSGATSERDMSAAPLRWDDQLKRDLIAFALFPLSAPAGQSPEQIWPGIDAIVAALDATIGGATASGDLRLGWQSAARFTSDLDRLYHIGELMEEAALAQLEARGSGAATRARVAAFIAQAQLGMIRANYQSSAALSITYRDMFFAENHVMERVLREGMVNLDDLSWMFPTSVRWAFLSLWEPGGATLRVRSSFFRDAAPIARGEAVAAPHFPPVERIPPAGRAEFVKTVPIRTASQRWGLLTYSMPLVAGDYDTALLWPALIGMALDQERLLASLSESQATLRVAYEQARALSDTVRELGCPLIPLLPGVLLVPLVGAIDEQRSRQIIDQVLGGVSREHAARVLLDITGVPLVDTQVAATLIQTARAVGLLGARLTLVGVRPEIAQSIVSLGVDLSLIETRPTLASAIQGLVRPTR